MGLKGKVFKAVLVPGVVLLLLAAGACLWLYVSVHWPTVDHNPVPFLDPPEPSNRIGPGYPPFRTEAVEGGFEVLDRSGRVMILRGATLDAGRHDGPPLAKLRRQGLNLVRLEIPWSDLEPMGGRASPDTLSRVSRFLDEAGRHGIGVLLGSRFEGAAPDWTRRISDSWDPTDGTVAAARFLLDFLGGEWTPDQRSLQDHLIGAWVTLAATVRNHPALVGYEAAPGPACPTPPASWFSMDEPDCRAALGAFHARFVQALRATDAKALLFMDARPAGAYVDGLVIRVPTPAEGVNPSDARAEATGRHGAPIVFTGALPATDFPSTGDMDRAGASWILPVETVIAATPLPFPERTAGRPVTWETRPDTGFRFTYRQGEVTAETFLFMPGGEPRWTVKVSDGHVHWPGDDPDVLVWITNPTVHTHTMTARTRPPSTLPHGDDGH